MVFLSPDTGRRRIPSKLADTLDRRFQNLGAREGLRSALAEVGMNHGIIEAARRIPESVRGILVK